MPHLQCCGLSNYGWLVSCCQYYSKQNKTQQYLGLVTGSQFNNSDNLDLHSLAYIEIYSWLGLFDLLKTHNFPSCF